MLAAESSSRDDQLVFSALDFCLDGVIITDTGGAVLYANQTSKTMFGFEADRFTGTDIRAFIPSASWINSQCLMLGGTTTAPRLTAHGVEAIGISCTGLEIPMEMTASRMTISGKSRVLYLMRDIRTRREVEDQLDSLQADLVHMARVSAMDEMGAALAHEINQPLTAAGLYLSALKQGRIATELSPAATGIVDKAIREAERAGQIVQRMRNFVEKRTPQKSEVAFEFIVDDAIELTTIGTRRVARIEKDMPVHLPMIYADAVQIQQVLVNLLRNAIEAVRDVPSPCVTVSAKVSQNQLCLAVHDNGPGIAEDIAPQLFKGFFSSKRDGLGVGLAISRTIAQNHGGELAVEPGGNGAGATFILTLPVAGN